MAPPLTSEKPERYELTTVYSARYPSPLQPRIPKSLAVGDTQFLPILRTSHCAQLSSKSAVTQPTVQGSLCMEMCMVPLPSHMSRNTEVRNTERKQTVHFYQMML